MWKANSRNIQYIKLLLATITVGHCLIAYKGHVEASIAPATTSLQSTQSKSKEHTLQRLSVEQGLSSSYVQDITQDQNGFLWIATSNGLNRYDAYDFKTFSHQANDSSSLGSNRINSLHHSFVILYQCKHHNFAAIYASVVIELNSFNPV